MAERNLDLRTGRRSLDFGDRGLDLGGRRRPLDLTAARPDLDDPLSAKAGGPGVGMAIVGELVKSYGFKRDEQSGDWGWDAGNIADAFSESPVWTTIDWLSLGFAPASYGVAAAKIGMASGKAGAAGLKVAKAARFADMGPAAKAVEAGTMGLRQATKLHRAHAAPRTAVGRLFSNPITSTVDDPEWAALTAQYGADPYQIRGLADVAKRELTVERGAWQRLAEDASRLHGGLDEATRVKLGQALEAGTDPGDELIAALGDNAAQAFEKTRAFRNSLHEASFKAGLISEETYVRNLKTYMPRLYEEYLNANPRLVKGAQQGGRARFLARTADDHPELTRIWEPTVALHQMAKAADVVAAQGYAQKLAGSVVAKTGDELLEHVGRYANNPAMRKIMGITDDAMAHLDEARAAGRLGIAEEQAKVFDAMGWRKFGDVFADSAKLPDYMKRLPTRLKERYIDPAAMDDVLGVFEGFGGHGDTNGFSTFLNKLYHRSLGVFRAGKTAYNPATHVRNYTGGIVFHHLATGGVPKFVPKQGFDALMEGGEAYTEAVKAGIVGSAFDVEVKEVLKEAFEAIGGRAGREGLEKLAKGQASAIDFMGNSAVAKYLQRSASKAERFYRGIDEVWKLDAFLDVKKKLSKGGLKGDDLVGRATLEVNKYMPQFSAHSPVGDVLRRAIPFASFTTEALRVWKNAMQAKPHLAFAYSHFAESASYAIGAANGYATEDVDAFREMAPEYTHNKKMMMLPFKVNGRPSFLDLSYLIPMGNISEAEESENLFFGALIDPTQNPLLGIVTAASTGIDPFTKREIQPRFTEQQLGIPIESPGARKVVGLAEHMAGTMLPPLAPPGFAGTNFLELARGQKHPVTGEPLEDAARTIAGNLFGMRTVEASVGSQLLNARRREAKLGDRIKVWRDAAQRARVSGDVGAFNEALDNIETLNEEMRPGTSDKYIQSFLKRTEPGEYRGVGERQLRASYENALKLRGIGGFGEEDRQTMTALSARLREKRGGRGRSRAGRSSRPGR